MESQASHAVRTFPTPRRGVSPAGGAWQVQGDLERSRPYDYYTGVRWDVADLIPEGVRSVLEVGCAAGRTGRVLRSRGIERLVGIEINPDSASAAQPYYDRLIVDDAEHLDCIDVESLRFDCIMYADVLEHFRNPWRVLSHHVKALVPGGYVAASIPNVRYYKTVRNLVLAGNWKYEDGGILDHGHLRFFTWKSIEELMVRSGLEITAIRHKVRGPTHLKVLNAVLFNRLRPFLVKQYLVLARKPG